jgi:hypothetical protein
VKGGPVKPLPKFSPPGENLALKAKVAVSGDYDAAKYPRKHINDGKLDWSQNGLRWLSHAETPNWIEFAWDAPQTLASARIVSGYNTGRRVVDSPIASFRLQYQDGHEWKDVPGSQVKGNTKPYWIGSFRPTKAARVRLVVSEVHSDISRIWEVELYGAAKGK